MKTDTVVLIGPNRPLSPDEWQTSQTVIASLLADPDKKKLITEDVRGWGEVVISTWLQNRKTELHIVVPYGPDNSGVRDENRPELVANAEKRGAYVHYKWSANQARSRDTEQMDVMLAMVSGDSTALVIFFDPNQQSPPLLQIIGEAIHRNMLTIVFPIRDRLPQVEGGNWVPVASTGIWSNGYRWQMDAKSR